MQTGSITAWEDVCSQCAQPCEAEMMTVTSSLWGTLTKRLSLCCNGIVVGRQAPQAIGTPPAETT